MKPRVIATAVMMAIAAGTALADDDCDVPMERWQSREAVRSMIAARGWRLHRLKLDDGCYEAHLTDADGRRLEVTIDPATLEILEIETRHPRR